MGEMSFSSEGPSTTLHMRRFLRSLGANKDEVFLVRQVHGDAVYNLRDASSPPAQATEILADAIITQRIDMPIGILTADCIPIVVYDPRLHVAGVIHAGRKGTAQRIVSKTIAAMQKFYGSEPQDILAGMGPGIGVCCYEVSADSIAPFKKLYPDWNGFVRALPADKFMLDLFSANTEDARISFIHPSCMVCLLRLYSTFIF